jgi:hypothetical protein
MARQTALLGLHASQPCVDDGTIGPVRCVLAARSWVLLGALIDDWRQIVERLLIPVRPLG